MDSSLGAFVIHVRSGLVFYRDPDSWTRLDSRGIIKDLYIGNKQAYCLIQEGLQSIKHTSIFSVTLFGMNCITVNRNPGRMIVKYIKQSKHLPLGYGFRVLGYSLCSS